MKRQLVLLLSESFQMFSAGVRRAAWLDKEKEKKDRERWEKECHNLIFKTQKEKKIMASHIKYFPWQPVV